MVYGQIVPKARRLESCVFAKVSQGTQGSGAFQQRVLSEALKHLLRWNSMCDAVISTSNPSAVRTRSRVAVKARTEFLPTKADMLSLWFTEQVRKLTPSRRCRSRRGRTGARSCQQRCRTARSRRQRLPRSPRLFPRRTRAGARALRRPPRTRFPWK